MKFPVLILSRDDVLETRLKMDEIIRIVEGVFRAHGEGRVIMPPKSVLPFNGERKGHINAMPAYIDIDNIRVAGIKWTSGFPSNREKGIPICFDIIILSDPETGVPFAILEGTWITSMRTAAATAVGIKYLAREGSKVIGMIGAGELAIPHIEAINNIMEVEKIKIYDLRKEICEKVVREAVKRFGVHIEQVENAYESANNSDIIVTITRHFGERFLDNHWVKKGALVAAIGGPNELRPELVTSVDKIVVDNIQQCLTRGNIGSLIKAGVLSESDIYAELGEIVIGVKKGRERDDERIIFAPMGMGTNDVAVAYKIYQMAKKKGVGKNFYFINPINALRNEK